MNELDGIQNLGLKNLRMDHSYDFLVFCEIDVFGGGGQLEDLLDLNFVGMGQVWKDRLGFLVVGAELRYQNLGSNGVKVGLLALVVRIRFKQTVIKAAFA